MLTLGYLLICLWCGIGLRVLFLYFIARLLKAGTVTIGRSIAAVAACVPISVGTIVLVGLKIEQQSWFPIRGPAATLGVPCLILAASLIMPGWICSCCFRSGFWRATFACFLSWLAVEIPLLVLFRLGPAEAFIQTANGAAPAMLGWHRDGTCPECGGKLFVPASNPDARRNWPPSSPDRLEKRGICKDCRQTGDVIGELSGPQAPDRFLIWKGMQPRRWDLVVFRFDSQSGIDGDIPEFENQVARLVGLPGEEISLRNGAVWINGQEVPLPDELRGLHYVSATELFRGPTDTWQLGPDEYFFLGDFSERANDSRSFGSIRRKDLLGVVTVRYWPPARWKIWR